MAFNLSIHPHRWYLLTFAGKLISIGGRMRYNPNIVTTTFAREQAFVLTHSLWARGRHELDRVIAGCL